MRFSTLELLFKEENMQIKPALIFALSLLVAFFSMYKIYVKAITSHDSSALLMFDYSFWLWTILAWISAFLFIKSYLVLKENI